MNLRKLILPILSLSLVVLSCKDDDETFTIIPDRDEQEVYDENLIEIEEYLATHFFNYEEFDATNPYSLENDSFTVVFDTIAGTNSSKTPIFDFLDTTTDESGPFPKLMSKTVVQNDIDYKLYYLVVREGLGKTVNALDQAAVLYNGTVVDGTFFDGAVNISSGNLFNLTGVVTGFREGIIEFKTATGFTDNLGDNGEPDGTVTSNGHGIGAVFIPSGLGYFSSPQSADIPQYSPIFFTLSVLSRSNTDFDIDGVPSHIEHPDGNVDGGTEDNTDGDSLANYIDGDDDGDGVLTSDEVIQNEYEEDDSMTPFMSRAEAQAYFDANAASDEIFISIKLKNDGNYTLNTLTMPNTNTTDSPDLPDYLDATVTTVL